MPEIEEKVTKAFEDIENQIDEFTNQGSGWSLDRILAINIHSGRYSPLRGSSYVPTPSCIPGRAVTNVKNLDDRCFMYAVLASLNPQIDNATDLKNMTNSSIN